MKSVKLLSIILLLLSTYNINAVGGTLVLDKGKLNICGTNTLSSSLLKVKGDCEFYWNQLLEPSDFAKDSNLAPQFVHIPKVWTAHKHEGNKIPSMGYATYRFVIEKDADVAPTIYGIKLSTVFSSYRLWINGELVTEVGKVGTTKETSEPVFRYQDLPFILDPAKAATDRIEVVIQVSNFWHQRAGLHFPIYISEYKNIVSDTRWMDILNLIIVGLILLIGINHLLLYFFRKIDRSNLYFGLVCLIMIVRNLSTGDRIIAYIFPNISWELLFKLDNYSGFATIPFFSLFIYQLFKKFFPRSVYRLLLIIGALITFLIIFTPVAFYGKFRLVYESYVLIGGLFLTFGVLFRATLKKQPYAIYSFIGMLILYGTTFNDVAGSMELVQTANLAPYGLVIFMLIQSIAINIKSARAINNSEYLGHQLQHEKENLERKVEERVGELKQQQQEIIQHQEKEKIEHWRTNGTVKINEVIVRHKDNYRDLCRFSLVELLKYINALLGDIYLLNSSNDEPMLEMVASYGLSKQVMEQNSLIHTDSGLIGASFTKNFMQHLTDIPDDYVSVSSGLGSAKPKSLLIVPLVFDDKVLGVMEIATFNEFSEIEIGFVEKIAEVIAGNVNTAMMNEQNIKMIQQFESKSVEMKETEARLRKEIVELEIVREQYERLRKEVPKK